jgi:hypothetical protein
MYKKPFQQMHKKLLILTVCLLCSVACSAGGIKGSFFSDKDIQFFWLMAIAIHVVAIIGYLLRTRWLKIICGVLYLPLFVVAFGAIFFQSPLGLIVIPMLWFYVYIIIKARNSSYALDQTTKHHD